MSRGICYSIISIVFLLLISCQPGEKVTEVIDGDTFVLANGQSVRLIGINTPETGEPGADIAKDMLSKMVLNRTVTLESDITDQDDYKRILRYVYVGGQSVNAEMIRMGYAEMRFYPPDTLFKSEYAELEKIAIRNRRGLWAFAVFQPRDIEDSIEVSVTETKALDIISWQDADKYYGQNKVVEGVIVVTNNTGKVCFLNFDRNWKKYFTAVIFASDFDKFPVHPEEYYLNRKVRVRGLIKEYKGKPEIILKSPTQIEIVTDNR